MDDFHSKLRHLVRAAADAELGIVRELSAQSLGDLLTEMPPTIRVLNRSSRQAVVAAIRQRVAHGKHRPGRWERALGRIGRVIDRWCAGPRKTL
jgi:hypothetical protein